MSIFSREDYEFLEIRIGGELLPPSPMEVIAPEEEDPYWEISYKGGITILATGDVVIKMELKELKLVEGEEAGKTGERRKRKVTSIDRVKESEGDAE